MTTAVLLEGNPLLLLCLLPQQANERKKKIVLKVVSALCRLRLVIFLLIDHSKEFGQTFCIVTESSTIFPFD